MYRTTSNLSRR